MPTQRTANFFRICPELIRIATLSRRNGVGDGSATNLIFKIACVSLGAAALQEPGHVKFTFH